MKSTLLHPVILFVIVCFTSIAAAGDLISRTDAINPFFDRLNPRTAAEKTGEVIGKGVKTGWGAVKGVGKGLKKGVTKKKK